MASARAAPAEKTIRSTRVSSVRIRPHPTSGGEYGTGNVTRRGCVTQAHSRVRRAAYPPLRDGRCACSKRPPNGTRPQTPDKLTIPVATLQLRCLYSARFPETAAFGPRVGDACLIEAVLTRTSARVFLCGGCIAGGSPCSVCECPSRRMQVEKEQVHETGDVSARCLGVGVYGGSLSPRRGTRALEGPQDSPRRAQARAQRRPREGGGSVCARRRRIEDARLLDRDERHHRSERSVVLLRLRQLRCPREGERCLQRCRRQADGVGR